MKKICSILLLFCFVIAALTQTKNQTKQSYRRALEVVTKSFEAMGGAANFDKSDLYNWADKAVTDSTVDMVEKIEKYGWQVETMISSHGRIITYQQIQDEAKEFKTKK